jgi:hypothetical protein
VTIIWVLLGFVLMLLLLTVVGLFCGRGHLGAPQSQSHYLDEVDAMSHFPHG